MNAIACVVLARLQKLDARVRAGLSRRVHEPAGQNGFDCLLLGVLDRLDEQGLWQRLPAGMSNSMLRNLIIEWLVDWQDLITDDDYTSMPGAAEISTLKSFGRDFSQFLEQEEAVGSHVSLLAACGVLSNILGAEVRAQVACPQPPAHVGSTPAHPTQQRHSHVCRAGRRT